MINRIGIFIFSIWLVLASSVDAGTISIPFPGPGRPSCPPGTTTTVFTSSGTFTPGPCFNWNNNFVGVLGAGSSGNNTGTSVNRASGAGGSWCHSSNIHPPIGVPVTVTVGAGGAGVPTTNNTSNPGEDSSFGSYVIAKGASAVVTAGVGAVGGLASGGTGQLCYDGGSGVATGVIQNGGGGAAGPSGAGGNGTSTQGGSANGGLLAGPTTNSDGFNGTNLNGVVGSGTGSYTTSGGTTAYKGGLYGGGGNTRGSGTSGAGAGGLVFIQSTVP